MLHRKTFDQYKISTKDKSDTLEEADNVLKWRIKGFNRFRSNKVKKDINPIALKIICK